MDSQEEARQVLTALRAGALVLERSAGTFADMEESDLRTSLCVAIEGRMAGSSTAESLNASGKTDILVRTNNRNVLVVECKIWSGPKNAARAIEQLLSYATWRDEELALIFFVGALNIERVIASTRRLIEAHPAFAGWLSAHKDQQDLLVLLAPTNSELRRSRLSILFVHLPRGVGRNRRRSQPSRPATGELQPGDRRPTSLPLPTVPPRPSLITTDHVASQQFLDPVHGLIALTGREVAILNHPAMARLRRLQQLSFVSFVYPGATHTRLEAAVGCLAMASSELTALARNRASQYPPPNPAEIALTRLGALVSRMGEISFERQVGVALGMPTLGRNRLSWALASGVWDGQPAMSLGELIDSQYRNVLGADGTGLRPSEVLIAVLDAAPTSLSKTEGVRLRMCRDAISCALGAVPLDSLLRDSFHVGMPAQFDMGRLFSRLSLGRREEDETIVCDLTAVGGRLDYSVATVLMTVEAVSSQLAERVYEHRTVRAAEAMFERVVSELVSQPDWSEGRRRLADYIVNASEESAVAKLQEIAGTSAGDSRGYNTRDLLTDLRQRQLHKRLTTFSAEELGVSTGEADNPSMLTIDSGAAQRRRRLLYDIEQELGLPPLSLSISWFPPRFTPSVMSQRAALGDEVGTVADFCGPERFGSKRTDSPGKDVMVFYDRARVTGGTTELTQTLRSRISELCSYEVAAP